MPDPAQSSKVARFESFELNLKTGQLRKGSAKIRLQEQSFQILAALLEQRGQLVTREALRERLWPHDTFVDFDKGLNIAISKLRQALGDSADEPRLVETLPRRGYRFIGTVEGLDEAAEIMVFPAGPAAERTISDHRLREKPGDGAMGPRPSRVAIALLIVTGAALLLLALRYFRARPTESPDAPIRRFAFTKPSVRSGFFQNDVAISPNGKHIAIAAPAGPGEQAKLWVQDLDQEQPRALEGTEGAVWPFWSPGSDLIGFVSGRELRRIPVQGGFVSRVCPLPFSRRRFSGATWSPDGNSIVFTVNNPPTLYEVPSRGGIAKVLARAEQESFSHPHFMPSPAAPHVLALAAGRFGSPMILHNLETRERESLVPGTSPVYSPSGHIVYQRSYSLGLWAFPFSLDKLQATGEPFQIVQSGRTPSVAKDGTLVYQEAVGAPKWRLVSVDREGKKTREIGPLLDALNSLNLSPDGRFLAMGAAEGSSVDVWLCDLEREVRTRLTSDLAIDGNPVWSPDGKQVAFGSDRAGNFDIFLRRADRRGEATTLLATANNEFVGDWSSDGRFLLYGSADPKTGDDIWYLRREENGSGWEPHPFLQTPFNETAAKLSPDGRHIAYVSDESGSDEVYVQLFPEGGNTTTVSTRGGAAPRWSRDGKELFYVEESTLVAVSVSTSPRFSVGSARRLFERPMLELWLAPFYDVSADGQRFFLAEAAEGTRTPVIRVVQNWFTEFEPQR